MKCMIVANWKMNPGSLKEAKKLFAHTKAVSKVRGVSLVVAPPAIYLYELSKLNRGGRIALGVQHAHFDAIGPVTGDISMAQARDAKATYAIIGHAERRARGETNDDTRKKVMAAFAHQMTPILCVGETERTVSGDYFDVIREQVKVGLKDVPVPKLTKVIIAYEPVWAIGAPAPMSPRDMHEMAIFIRKQVVERYGDVGLDMQILYGGAVDSTNAPALLEFGDIKGFLVGRASADRDKVAALMQSLS